MDMNVPSALSTVVESCARRTPSPWSKDSLPVNQILFRVDERPPLRQEIQQIPGKYSCRQVANGAEFSFSPQLTANYNKEQAAMWTRWSPSPRACFNPALLENLRDCYDFLGSSNGIIRCDNEDHPMDYVVQASSVPGVFNLGGDLDLFRQLIERHNRDALMAYAKTCVELVYKIYQHYDAPVTTIALVQGECLGGGFEAALPNDVIVAEKRARFGFPEIIFNLFPGMGAYSYLERKVGQRTTEELLTSGKIYSAQEMFDLGVVDVIAEDDEGEAEVGNLIKKRQRLRNAYGALAAVRRRVHGIELAELIDIVEIWVDSALRLNPRDLKLMQRLVSKQDGLGDSTQIH
jgi:DSF synthase